MDLLFQRSSKKVLHSCQTSVSITSTCLSIKSNQHLRNSLSSQLAPTLAKESPAKTSQCRASQCLRPWWFTPRSIAVQILPYLFSEQIHNFFGSHLNSQATTHGAFTSMPSFSKTTPCTDFPSRSQRRPSTRARTKTRPIADCTTFNG